MKTNRLAYSFLCLLLILELQGCGQKKDATSAEKTSGAAATNNSVSGSSGKSGKAYKITVNPYLDLVPEKSRKDYEVTDNKTGRTLTLHFDSPPNEAEIEKKFSEYYLKTFNETKAKAEAGDAEAQYTLGSYYQNGVGVATNEVEGEKWYCKAAEWYLKAAEQGDAHAQYNLGCCYANGDGVSKDIVEAVKWYRKAAEQGDADAQVDLGIHFENGDGVDKDYVQAYKWYCVAAARGNEMARLFLSIVKEKMAPEQIEEAKQLVRKEAPEAEAKVAADIAADERNQFEADKLGAEKGNRWDQLKLALDYDLGKGVPQNEVEAVKWYRKAAEQGDALAQDFLGDCYQQGKGVTKDYVQAVKWYRKAAEQGQPYSEYSLGFCYANGEGVPKDYPEAYKWWNLAAASQVERTAKHAADARNRLELQMSPEQIAEGQRLASEFKPRKQSKAGPSDSNKDVDQLNPLASGTGFFITEDGFLITNEHVVKDAAKVRLVTSAGLISAKVVSVDAANDLALLKANGKFSPLPIAASRTAHLGGTVATVGFPNIGLQGFSPKLAKGEIASLAGAADDARYFQISVPVQPGNSGGALVDEHGNVVGVVSAKLNASAALAASGALPENVNYAVKSSFLLSFLESVPEVSAKLKPPSTSDRKFEDVVKSAQSAAVLVLVY